jgi:chemotaxis signal transduction protein
MTEEARVGGLLLRADAALYFVPATVAIRIASPPRITPVPGTPAALVGITLHEGVVVPVISIGSGRGEMVVCLHSGELVGIVGGSVVRVGAFERAGPASSDRVTHEGQIVEPLDVGTIYTQIQSRARLAAVL